MKSILLLLVFVKMSYSLNCWSYSDYQYEGNIDNSDKTQITCNGDYCMSISEEGSNFNQFNGTCPDPSVKITDCATRGNGCQDEKVRGVYIKVCCCNTDLCNNSNGKNIPIISLFSVITLKLCMSSLFSE